MNTIRHMADDVLKGWCNNCGFVRSATDFSEESEMFCEECGDRMKPTTQMSAGERATSRFMEWMSQVADDGKWGLSPGGAAGELKCSRATIDDLVRRGVLEKSEYNADGHHVILISERSILKAKENKKRTGRWTGYPKGFDPDLYER